MDAQMEEFSQWLEAKQNKKFLNNEERLIRRVFYCNWAMVVKTLVGLGLKVQISFSPITFFDPTGSLCWLSHKEATSHPFPPACQSTPLSGTIQYYSCDVFLLKQLFWKSNHLMLHWILPQICDFPQPAVHSATVFLCKAESVVFPKRSGDLLIPRIFQVPGHRREI